MSDPIPQSAPGRAYREHRDELDTAVRRVLESGWYILGAEVSAFESEFAEYLGVPHAIGVANGTDALELALRTFGIGPGDAVFTVSHTAVATVAAIERCGALPVLVDVDPARYTMDPAGLRTAVGSRIQWQGARAAAVVPVHLYGQMADMPAIVEIANAAGLRVIEDCAQAHGASLDGRPAGTWGDAGAFSFYPTKNLGAFGDGGAVVTRDNEAAARTRSLRQYGWGADRISTQPGLNSRLDELQAAILRVGLRHLGADNISRRRIASRYDLLGSAGVGVPAVTAGADHVYHQYVIRAEQRDGLRAYLDKKAIGTAIHYPVPIHLQPAYRGRVPNTGPLEVTERIAGEIVSLPMFPSLETVEVERVCAAVASWAARSGV